MGPRKVPAAISTGIVDLAYTGHGPSDGVPIVLLHGFPLNGNMWRHQVATLKQAGCYVVVPDLRGHGRSPTPDEPADMESQALDVFALTRKLGMNRFVLGGLSMGGYVALQCYAKAPEHILGLVLADTRAEPDSEEARKGRRATAERVRSEGVGIMGDAMGAKLLSPRTLEQNPTLLEEVRTMIRSTSASGLIRALEGLASRPDQRGLLPRIRVPTLVLVGSDDTLTPPPASRSMAEAIPGARLALIEEAGHLSPLEKPDQFNRLLLGWLRETGILKPIN